MAHIVNGQASPCTSLKLNLEIPDGLFDHFDGHRFLDQFTFGDTTLLGLIFV